MPIGKFFEKVVCSQLTDYFEINNLLSDSQHGFRSNHSNHCETALLALLDKWKLNLDKKLINLALFTDFRKAFDLVNAKLKFFCLIICSYFMTDFCQNFSRERRYS